MDLEISAAAVLGSPSVRFGTVGEGETSTGCSQGGTFIEIGLINNLSWDSNLFNHTRKAERNHSGVVCACPGFAEICKWASLPSVEMEMIPWRQGLD